MKLAFFRGRGDWISYAIRRFSRGPHSHVELVFSDGTRFGASGRDRLGVSFRGPIADPAEYDFVDLRVSTDREAAIRRACEALQGSRFDWLGLIEHLFRPRPRTRFYCVPLVVELLQHAGAMSWAVDRRSTPSDLFRVIS
jgi:hypothetical protein